MPTKQPRLNVVLNRETREGLAMLAAQRDMTLSGVAADLIEDALEEHEDRYWSAVVEERRKDKNSPLAHDEFWASVKKMKAQEKRK